MKKRFISIGLTLVILGSIVVTLANNKVKINKAAAPVKENTVIPVKVHEVKEESFSTAFSINGTTTPIKEVKIASEVQGKLISLYVKNGDEVRAGQVIATLDASVYTSQLYSIESNIQKEDLDIERYTKLVELGGATPMQLEDHQLKRKSYVAQRKSLLEQMAHMQIRAPFSGRIENVNVENGSYVSYGTVLAELLDNTTLKIKTYLSEQEAYNLKVKQGVGINSVVLSKPVIGEIHMISDKADGSGKFLAEIYFNNNGKEKLKAGMLADISFNHESLSWGLAIPVSAIVASTKNAKVFVVKENKVEERIIKTGIVTAEKAQVVEGLQAGERVVLSGQLNLENGSSVTVNQ